MKKITAFFRPFLITTKSIRYHGHLEILQELFEEIETNKFGKEEFTCLQTAPNNYILNPFFSVGTMQTSINDILTSSSGIAVSAKIISRSETLQEIQLTGKMNPVHYVIIAIFFFFLLGFGLSGKLTIVGFLVLFATWVIFHIWFNFIWASQEKAVIEDLKKSIALKMRMRSFLNQRL